MQQSFLQSNAWERFQQAAGAVTRRIDGVLVIERKTPLGLYWYCPRPSLDVNGVRSLEEAAIAAGAMFVRVDPETPVPTGNLQSRLTAHTEPGDSLVLSLAPTEDELLKSFHEKTRYNIRVAERNGLVVEESSDPESRALTAFLQFARRTSERQGFRYHSDVYYRTMLEVLGRPNDEAITASALVAHKDNGPAAAMIVIWTPETAYYLHGASWYERRKWMAPHLLQWTAMKLAKARGAKAYDFWGIAPVQIAGSQSDSSLIPQYSFDPQHPWAGVTRFKLGFGGKAVHYPDAIDLVISRSKYNLYTFGRRVRRALPF